MLSLTTLGGLAVRRPDFAPPDLRLQRRRLGLLAALAAAGTRGLTRDRLALLLWPESDSESARNNLKQGIFALRRDLGADVLAGEAQELRLNPEVWECDRWRFEEALAHDDPDQAVAVYGGPFLDGFHVGGESEEFERWADHERAGLAAAYREGLQKLADRAEEANDVPGACRWWRRLASLDPLDGRIAVGLISATARSGNVASALQLAREHQEMVRGEVGIEPDPAVIALADRIRKGTFPDRRPALVLLANGAATPSPQGDTNEVPLARSIRPLALLERLRTALAGRYVIHEGTRNRSGGPTRSYAAIDSRHGRAVILKALHPSLASQLDAQRFVREIALTARLQHPHLVPLLESGEVEGIPWFTAPDIAGESLRDRLGHDPFVIADEASRMLIEIADALDYAHRHGVVHRDVTPENILLAADHAFLVNLGVARALETAATSELTETGMMVGSPAYMSPEQASGKPVLDGRSDVYSLACVLYEMLAGEPLHSGPTPQAIMAKRVLEISPKLTFLTSVPATLVAAISQALSIDPAARFASASAFAECLKSPTSP